MIAPLLMMAAAAVPASIAEVRANAARYHGQRVLLEGWVIKCRALDCHLTEKLAVRFSQQGQSLSFEENDQLGRQLRPLLPVQVEVEATIDATCFSGKIICLDRSPELRDAVVRKIRLQNHTFPEE